MAKKYDIKTDAQSCKRIVVYLMGISGGLWVVVVGVGKLFFTDI